MVAAARRLAGDGQGGDPRRRRSGRGGEHGAGRVPAALVAQGLGSDHGDFDLTTADAFINHSNKAVSG